MELAGVIAAKDPVVVRAAKASLNGIDPVDVRRSYRYEQGFTFELNLLGAGDAARESFLRGGYGAAYLVGTGHKNEHIAVNALGEQIIERVAGPVPDFFFALSGL